MPLSLPLGTVQNNLLLRDKNITDVKIIESVKDELKGREREREELKILRML
jgi:hypothetical protein